MYYTIYISCSKPHGPTIHGHPRSHEPRQRESHAELEVDVAKATRELENNAQTPARSAWFRGEFDWDRIHFLIFQQEFYDDFI